MARRIGRRQALGTIGGVGFGALLAACGGGGSGDRSSGPPSTSAPGAPTSTVPGGSTASDPSDPSLAALFDDAASCAVTPSQTEGPFYVDTERVRRDITDDRDGTPLKVALRVRDSGACTPICAALVDIWHADADGVYSGFEDGAGASFLRGVQVTDGDGIVQFTTIYPGAYQGRTVHIHAKVHLDNRTALTTQLYFDDDVSDTVLDRAPYRGADGRTRNDDDGLFVEETVLTMRPEGDGFLGIMTFDVRT